MINAVAATIWVFAALLVVTGGIKVVRPLEVERALRSVGVPLPRGSGRLLGLAEVAVGLAVFVIPGPLPALGLSLMYVGFVVFVVVALRKGGVVRSCGCVGRPDTPPTPLHLLLDVLGAGSGFAGAFSGTVTWQSGPITETLLVIVLTGVATWLGYSIVALPISWRALR